ncbi:ribosome biogenesis GTP-binding protein YihA/YsxC [Spiribacter onubensis]|uniref:Probable GTP-binding protein EngB n=1 Tax=Spiribacter onubensis TaxID=3122420 RepID=A0ABV3SAM5_9GAMM
MSIDYRQAQFLLSAAEPRQLPDDIGHEVAFAGRSNAGKSSALNAITDQKQLARVSKTPGRTQQINVFPVGAPDSGRRLIDLPGYGYAKAPPALRAHWQKALPQYLETRASLRGLVLITDIRHPLGQLDEQMLMWCEAARLPVHILLSKADKLRRGPAGNTLQSVRTAALRTCPGASIQLFSAQTRQGVETARARLDEWLQQA